MEKANLTAEQYDRLVDIIFSILAEKGPSHTSMDLLASRLQMSKRTLYEIFGSKDEMIKATMHHLHDKYALKVEEIVHSYSNVMEVLVRVLILHQSVMSKFSADFFKDFDDRYNHLRPEYDSETQKWSDQIARTIRLGIRQGVFRPEANYKVIIPLLRVQMESLKRMEEFFPADITLSQAFRGIAEGFLRNIATPHGMEIIDMLQEKLESETMN